MYAASSEAKKATAYATSSALPQRPSGINFFDSSFIFSGMPDVKSVGTKPGAIAFTVILREATSRAKAFVNPIKPAFEAE